MSYLMILMLFAHQDQDYYLVDSDGYGTPGSPCFSVHSRSTDEINMILEEEANYREVSVEFGNVDNVLDSSECCDGHMNFPEEDDIAHRNNVLRNEARKVLEVGKLLVDGSEKAGDSR
ncbi:hypothetical protein COLO4_26814 [Corchorus olitorius]|uniref:Uncharacterized protein n=1 Tax=Corchorus olitorius TaxID=93759 RepID=A0A1R3HU31_9ROSI|nr:hypothetical protein COLO4_26814 [Corchorus olitorius]